MSTQGKIQTVLLGLVAALGLAVAATAITFQMRERDLRLAKERELMVVTTEKEDIEQQLREAKAANQQIERQLAQTKDQLDQSTKQLAEELQVKAQLTKTLDERQQEIERIGKDLDQARTERVGLTDQLSRLKTEQAALQKQLKELQEAKAQLEQKVVELDKVVVKPASTIAQAETTPSPAPAAASVSQPAAPAVSPQPATVSEPGVGGKGSSLQGQVIVVNREYDFIVVNLGSRQGLSIGQELHVVRGNQVVGRVKVEKLYDELSAAAILPDSNKDAIHEGDLVKVI